MNENPQVNAEKAALEVKDFLDKKKMDLVDYTYWNIEAYPNPESDEYPELKNFAKLWKDLFDELDKLVDDDGNGFPNEIVKKYEAELAKVVDLVNSDKEYWERIRKEVLPLYEPPKLPEEMEKKRSEEAQKETPQQKAKRETKEKVQKAWLNRWQKIEMFYDPVDFEVVTTQMMTNKKTGERTRGDVVRKTTYPQGFVVKII